MHNSLILRIFNNIINFFISRYAVVFYGRKIYVFFFLGWLNDLEVPPKVICFDNDLAKLTLCLDKKGFIGFSAENLTNTGYWLKDDVKIEWVYPKRSKQIKFLPPKSIDNVDSKYWLLLNHEPQIFSAEVTAQSVQNCFVYSGALLQADHKLIDVDPWQKIESIRRGVIHLSDVSVIARSRSNLRALDRTEGVYIGVSLDFLFFEALIYGLPKFMKFIRESKYKNFVPIVNDYTNPKVREFWDKILHKFDRMPTLGPSNQEYLNVKNLKLVQSGINWVENLNKSDIDLIINSSISCESKTVKRRKVILLREKNARHFDNRIPINYDDLVSECEKIGFEPIDLGALALEEQIAIMRECEFVISPHGGALANIIWCNPKSIILEIFSGWNDNCFEMIARRFELKYHSYFCQSIPLQLFTKSKDSRNYLKIRMNDLVPYVDVKKFLNILDELAT